MAPKNGYATYDNRKITTATPADLTLMLYEGAIKFANIAKTACIDKDIEKAHNNIRRCDAIIENFQNTLNFDYEVAQDFNNVYSYIRSRLVIANFKKDPEILNEILKHLRIMRDTWKEVMKLTANGTKIRL